MHQREARRPRQQLQRPVERRIAATEDHQALAGELAGAADTILDGAALEGVGAFDADASRLEGAEARGDHHRAGVEADPARGGNVKAPVLAPRKLHHLVAEVQLRFEGPDLLQQPVDQLLGTANRQRRDVVDRLVGVELGTLSAGVAQRVDDVRADPEQSQLKHLEQSAGSGADDDGFGADRRGSASSGRNRAQGGGFRRQLATAAL